MSEMLIQEDPRIAAKRRMAMAIMQGGQTPVTGGSGLEGVSRLVQTLLGAYMEKQAVGEEKASQDRGNAALADAIGYGNNPNLAMDKGGVKLNKQDFTDPVFDQSKINALPSGREAMLQRLAQTPETQPMAGKLGLQMALQPPEAPVISKPGDVARDPRTGAVRWQTPAAPKELPEAVQTALFQSNGDPAKAREILAAKGMDGDWAIDLATGKPAYLPKATLLNAKPGTYAPRPNGMKITSDGQGGFEIATGDGVGEGGGTTKATQTNLEGTIVTGRDAISRLAGIEQKFKPEYQQLGSRWQNFKAAGLEKLGMSLDPATKQTLTDFTSYRRDAVANVNQTIKDMTGATVSAQEAPRLQQQMPVPGQGLIDGDSPTEFQAKLAGTMASLKASVARAEYARKNGLSKQQQFGIPLETIPQMVQAKGDQYRDELKRANPTAGEQQIAEMVKTRLREEFGL